MVELTTRERLQPSLLDRLTDDSPDKRVLSVQKIREGVLRDLSWLFNTASLSTVQDLSQYPYVAQSVLNYGMPDLAGHTASGIDVRTLQHLLRESILNYEPRLIRQSLKVKLKLSENEMSHNTLGFDIEGELWSQPLPLRVYMKTEIDLEAGQVTVTDYNS